MMEYGLFLAMIGTCIRLVSSQDVFFRGTITCYECLGSETNSSCSDPFSLTKKTFASIKEVSCQEGACLKRVYKDSEKGPMIMRTCTNTDKLVFNLPLVHNVCQDENDGFGYLCMCGRSFCNSANTRVLSRSLALCTVLTFLQSLLN
ncbi:uncharacterized protein [Watersipora subatra]|uniref:uncharacterized protein n=1 Tax=Watersipora subatra TaxID=2589382 RepID=UPI00355B7480